MLFYQFGIIDTMVNPNSWYIAMHFDRLNQELIDGFNRQDEEDQHKKKKSKRKTNTDIENTEKS